MKINYKTTLYSCYISYITQAIINNLAPLLFIIFQDKFQITFQMLGSLILINFVTQLTVDIITVKIVNHFGYRPLMIFAHICAALGLIGLGILPNILNHPYIGLVISIILYAIGGGLIEVLVSPIVDSIPGDNKSGAMSLLHSFYCWGQVGVVLITTLLLFFLGRDRWEIIAVLWSLIPISNFFLLIRVPLMSPVPEEGQTPLRKLFTTKSFLLVMIIMVCAGASELTMSQWSSLFAEKGLNVSKVFGDLLGPCLFAIFMGIGRMSHGLWGSKIKLEKLLMASAFLCVSCYLITVFSPYPILSLIACGITGLSVSLMWPGAFSIASDRFPYGGASMFGVLAVCGDLGCASGPWISGIVSNRVAKLNIGNPLADQLALKSGLLIGTIFPLVLLICLLLATNSKKKIVVVN
jgi:fucose permease